MDIDVNAIYLTLLVFGLKLIFVLLITSALNCNEKRGGNFAIAWITSYLYEIAAMFTLSFLKCLYALQLILVMVIGLIIAGAWLFIKRKRKSSRYGLSLDICFSDVIPLTIMIAFCIYCAARAFLYFDTTPDASSYGMPRIFLFSNSGSLFINMDTLSKNIFVNEWNGELNAVFYRVLTGNNVSIPFANIETYFYAGLSLIFLGKDLFKEKRYSIYPAYLVMFLPVVVFLAYTCKGDLLGMVTFPIFVLILFLYWKEERDGISSLNLLFGTVISGALATGARITIIPAVGLIMLIMLGDFLFRKKYREIRIVLLSACISYIIGWGRYILNFLYYSNFFERVDAGNETVAPNISRFCTSLVKYIQDIVYGENIFTHEGIMWALNADAGVLGIFILNASI
ncbi:MAG: hypothetical protein PUC12_04520, partial [Clostridiales bacterium]|nr:hypothetical protein [Clostridiales bacterium]